LNYKRESDYTTTLHEQQQPVYNSLNSDNHKLAWHTSHTTVHNCIISTHPRQPNEAN
jgi:hypothetical protein